MASSKNVAFADPPKNLHVKIILHDLQQLRNLCTDFGVTRMRQLNTGLPIRLL